MICMDLSEAPGSYRRICSALSVQCLIRHINLLLTPYSNRDHHIEAERYLWSKARFSDGPFDLHDLLGSMRCSSIPQSVVSVPT
jgi:hypothetical protein